jgi:hypothetical protein
LLSHLPEISIHALFLAAHWRWDAGISLPLFVEMAAQTQGKEPPLAGRTLDDTIRMARALGQPIAQFRSIPELETRHDRLVRLLNRSELQNPENKADFPDPPLEGTDTIIPLASPSLLTEEGRLQNHCAAILADEIYLGVMYVYRPLAPERACVCDSRGMSFRHQILIVVSDSYGTHNGCPEIQSQDFSRCASYDDYDVLAWCHMNGELLSAAAYLCHPERSTSEFQTSWCGVGRGRTASCLAAPAQIPAGGITAPGSCFR